MEPLQGWSLYVSASHSCVGKMIPSSSLYLPSEVLPSALPFILSSFKCEMHSAPPSYSFHASSYMLIWCPSSRHWTHPVSIKMHDRLYFKLVRQFSSGNLGRLCLLIRLLQRASAPASSKPSSSSSPLSSSASISHCRHLMQPNRTPCPPPNSFPPCWLSFIMSIFFDFISPSISIYLQSALSPCCLFHLIPSSLPPLPSLSGVFFSVCFINKIYPL